MKITLFQALLILIFSTCLCVSASRSKPKPDPNNDGDPPLKVSCEDDIHKFCEQEFKHGNMFLLYCLEQHKSQLSKTCQKYLGSTAMGGCDNDAQTLCPDESSVGNIMQCLNEHKADLTEQCLANIKNNAENPWKEARQRLRHITGAITALAMTYLLVPLAIALWAAKRAWNLHVEQRKALKRLQLSSMPTVSVIVSTEPMQISVRDLSYWTAAKSSWLGSSTKSVQILRSVTAQFKPTEITAIMGPSGSGKTTLLRLLAGQLGEGAVRGRRVSSACSSDPSLFDVRMRTQGYVSQQDTLAEGLTVWETLLFASLLRIPENLANTSEKMARAYSVMKQLGLHGLADCRVGGSRSSSDGSEAGGISGGQRRRLSIAIELLGNPSVLFLDEATSGLDSSTSLSIVSTLLHLCKSQQKTILLTIHQPRSEVFELFDGLVLLGTGGHLIYSGRTRTAAEFLSTSQCTTLRLDKYDNPGDFILDVLGVQSNENESKENSNIESTDDKQLSEADESVDEENGVEMKSIPKKESRGAAKLLPSNQLVEELSHHFQQSQLFSDLCKEVSLATDQPKSAETRSRTRKASGGDYSALNVLDESTGSSSHVAVLAGETKDVDGSDSEGDDRKLLQSHSSASTREGLLPLPSVLGVKEELASNVRSYPNSFASQTWMLFARRCQMFKPTRLELLSFAFQISMVCSVITITFCYDVDTELELPYQVFMILFVISTYVMIIQLIPEYMSERANMIKERSARVIGFGPYIASALLTEVPRAIVQCCFLLGLVYWIRPLNPDSVSKTFCFVTTMVGVCAWQSLICLCSMLTDSVSVAYTICFLVLGSGTLFGGLLVRLSKIPVIFRPLYYASIVSVTQRALIVNDMQCCYLTATCNGIASTFHSDPTLKNPFTLDLQTNHSVVISSFCPPGLQFSGDGSDEGNLGRVFLKMMNLENDNPFAGLLILFWANIFFRCLAFVVLLYRDTTKSQLDMKKTNRTNYSS